MPKFYVIDVTDFTEYESEEAAIREARKMGASGMVVKAVVEVSWHRPEPVFTIKGVDD